MKINYREYPALRHLKNKSFPMPERMAENAPILDSAALCFDANNAAFKSNMLYIPDSLRDNVQQMWVKLEGQKYNYDGATAGTLIYSDHVICYSVENEERYIIYQFANNGVLLNFIDTICNTPVGYCNSELLQVLGVTPSQSLSIVASAVLANILFLDFAEVGKNILAPQALPGEAAQAAGSYINETPFNISLATCGYFGSIIEMQGFKDCQQIEIVQGAEGKAIVCKSAA